MCDLKFFQTFHNMRGLPMSKSCRERAAKGLMQGKPPSKRKTRRCESLAESLAKEREGNQVQSTGQA